MLRQLMVIGEAASALDEELRNRLPDVPWHEIRGLRNHAVHAYFALDWAIVWEIADANLPALEEQVLALLAAEYPDLADALDASSSHSDDRIQPDAERRDPSTGSSSS